MKTKSFSLPVSDAIGSVTTEYIISGKSNCIIRLAHGAGVNMNYPFMTLPANSLTKEKIATLRLESGARHVAAPSFYY